MTNPSQTSAVKRLMYDFKQLQGMDIKYLNAKPDDSNMFHWKAVIFGPDGTPFEDGTFCLTLDFPQTYPMHAPMVRFDPPIFHPNVYANGAICLDLLNTAWSPTTTVYGILLSIQTLLTSPNPNSPANAEAAGLYQHNRGEYDKRVKQCVEASWGKAADGKSETRQEDIQKKQSGPEEPR